MRPIDADKLKEGIACHKQWTDQEYETDRQWALGYNAGIERALFSIRYAPTIEAEPVRHGRWEEVSMDTVCSVCGTKFNDEMYWIQGDGMNPNYCPECGAKMDKKEEAE